MPLYPERIARCQHIKIDGMQVRVAGFARQDILLLSPAMVGEHGGVSVGAQKDRWRLAELMRFTEGSGPDLDVPDRPVRGSRDEEGTEALKETLRLQFERQAQGSEVDAERMSSRTESCP